jgi:hypothetical protein
MHKRISMPVLLAIFNIMTLSLLLVVNLLLTSVIDIKSIALVFDVITMVLFIYAIPFSGIMSLAMLIFSLFCFIRHSRTYINLIGIVANLGYIIIYLFICNTLINAIMGI